MTSMTRLPTGTPARPWAQPGTTSVPRLKLNGCPVGACADGQEVLKTLPVRQILPTYCATTVSPFTSFGPEPLINVVTDRPLGGELFGTVITGAAPALALTAGSDPPPC